MKPTFRFLGVLLVVALLAVPAVGQVTPQDIAESEAQLQELRAETDQLAAQYEAAVARSAVLETQVARLEGAVQDSQIQLGTTRQLVRERAVEMYIESSTAQISLLFVEDLDGGIEVAIGYLEQLGTSDTKVLRDLEIIKTEYQRQLTELETVRLEQEAVVSELSSVGTRLSARLESAQQTYVALVAQRAAEDRAQAEEDARRRAEQQAAARAAAAATTTSTSTAVTTTSTGNAPTTTTSAAPTTTTTTLAGTTTTTTTETTTTTTCSACSGRRTGLPGRWVHELHRHLGRSSFRRSLSRGCRHAGRPVDSAGGDRIGVDSPVGEWRIGRYHDLAPGHQRRPVLLRPPGRPGEWPPGGPDGRGW